MANNIEGLREHLFDMIEALKDKKNPIEIDRALAVSTVCQTVINSLKVEVEARKLGGDNTRSPFIEIKEDENTLPPVRKSIPHSDRFGVENYEPSLRPGPGVTIHKKE